jgi:hypothetical protein
MGKGDIRISIAIQPMHIFRAKTGLTYITTLTFHIELGLDGRYEFLARFVPAWANNSEGSSIIDPWSFGACRGCRS